MNGYLDRRFLIILFFSFAFLVGYLLVVSNQTYVSASIQTANETRQIIEMERSTVTAQEMFINNLMVSISLVVPLIGLVPFIIVWHNSATVIGLLSKAYAVPPAAYIANLVVLAFPEILAYTILMAENIYVAGLALFRAGAKQRLVAHSWKSLILYFFLLWIGAITEVMYIA